jgi:hypothetical protein
MIGGRPRSFGSLDSLGLLRHRPTRATTRAAQLDDVPSGQATLAQKQAGAGGGFARQAMCCGDPTASDASTTRPEFPANPWIAPLRVLARGLVAVVEVGGWSRGRRLFGGDVLATLDFQSPA